MKYFDKDPKLISSSWEEKSCSEYQVVGAYSPSPTHPISLLSGNVNYLFFFFFFLTHFYMHSKFLLKRTCTFLK